MPRKNQRNNIVLAVIETNSIEYNGHKKNGDTRSTIKKRPQQTGQARVAKLVFINPPPPQKKKKKSRTLLPPDIGHWKENSDSPHGKIKANPKGKRGEKVRKKKREKTIAHQIERTFWVETIALTRPE